MQQESPLNISPEVTLKLEEIVQERVTSIGTPGIFATLFQGDHILFEKGLGVRATEGTAPDANTTFRIASCTKSFTIAALLKLRDEGKLHLDQQITDFVPEFTFSTLSSAQTIPTLRHLASMSSGLPTDDPWADRQESISSQELREIVRAGVNATNASGELFQYSNLGFALLGLTIESASGRDFREFVTTEFLKPLGMNETGFDAHEFPEGSLAKGYRKVDKSWLELPFSKSGAFSSIGGLFSSARDLRVWSNWFFSAFTNRNNNEGLLSSATRREMQRITTPIPINVQPKSQERLGGYGLGLFVEDDRRFGQFVSHSGGYPGFSSHMRWHIPTGLSVVVLENATYSGAMTTAIALLEAALDGLNYQVSKPKAWGITDDFAAKVDEWIRNISNGNALPPVEIFSENVDLDIPFPQRIAKIEGLIQEVGGLKESTGIRIESSDSPLHLIWTIFGNQGDLSCEIRLTPAFPTKIQTFRVKVKSL